MDEDVKQDDPAQSQRFIDMAKEVGASDESLRFKRVFTKLLDKSVTSADPDRGN